MRHKQKTIPSQADGKFRVSSPISKHVLIALSVEGKNDQYRFKNFIQKDENCEINNFRTCTENINKKPNLSFSHDAGRKGLKIKNGKLNQSYYNAS